ncbi:MAG: hypothetical protein Ct9H300mP20_17810 [Gammaproteobacteria bacterium]|nr:MAG: hypothetical protein Ct9H300mP20_17810 [Gammaproteobacteria bacterium]
MSSNDFWTLPGGDVGVFFGFEYRDEEMSEIEPQRVRRNDYLY